MKLSNIRIEDTETHSYLTVDIECGFSTSKSLWFSVSENYKNWLTNDVYDAFMIAAVWPCMCYKEDIIIEGYVSKKLYKNLTSYVIPLIKSLRPDYECIDIKVKGFKCAYKDNSDKVGTGFSGGVDSFSTLINKFEKEEDIEYKINTLFFFHIGQYGNINNKNTEANALKHYKSSKRYADEVRLPYVYMNSNMFEFYRPEWEYDAGPLCRIASILVFQRKLCRYYVSGSYHYQQIKDFETYHHLDDIADPFIYIMLSPENLDIILDGSQYYRYEKTKLLVEYEPAQRYLEVCVSGNLDKYNRKNCSVCHKCNRTLIVLDASGKLDLFSNVFDIDKYKAQRDIYLSVSKMQYHKNPFAKENYDYAKSHGIKVPNKFQATITLFIYRFRNLIKRITK